MGSLIKKALHVTPYATIFLLALPFLPVLILGAVTLSPLAVIALAMGSLSGAPQAQLSASQEQAAPGVPEWELRRHEPKRGEIEEVSEGPSLLTGTASADRKVQNGGSGGYMEDLKKDVLFLAATSGVDVSKEVEQPQTPLTAGLEQATDTLFHLHGIEPPLDLKGPAQERLGHKVKVLKTQIGIA